MQKKSLLIISLIVSIILTASTVVFAWFTMIVKTQPIFIFSGSVKTNAELFVLDKSDAYQPVTNEYSFNNVVPNQTFDFKLVVENQGTLDANLILKLTFLNDNPTLLDYLILSYDEITVNPLTSEYEFELTNNLIEGSYYITDEFNNRVEQYNNLTFNFSLKVSPLLTKEDVINMNELVLKNIEITLVQAGDF